MQQNVMLHDFEALIDNNSIGLVAYTNACMVHVHVSHNDPMKSAAQNT